jgi:hypothetical protein
MDPQTDGDGRPFNNEKTKEVYTILLEQRRNGFNLPWSTPQTKAPAVAGAFVATKRKNQGPNGLTQARAGSRAGATAGFS